MQLSRKAIDDFKKIYLDEFRVILTDQEANIKGLELLNFIGLIYRPIPIDSKSSYNKLVQESQNE